MSIELTHMTSELSTQDGESGKPADKTRAACTKHPQYGHDNSGSDDFVNKQLLQNLGRLSICSKALQRAADISGCWHALLQIAVAAGETYSQHEISSIPRTSKYEERRGGIVGECQ
jgi:hypothetical protein